MKSLSLGMASTILLSIFVLLLCSSGIHCGKIPALFAFGDSILDTGNNDYIMSFARGNFPPYGIDFPGGVATGRFSNGRVISDVLAEGLGIKTLLPPYLDPKLQPSDLPTGVCFASGGSGLDDKTANAMRVISMGDQLKNFKEYITKLQGAVGPQNATSILANGLIIISAGNNDFATFYRGSGGLDMNGYVSKLIGLASDFVKELYGLGARRIAFMSTLPVGCLPTKGPYLPCTPLNNAPAIMFNTRLSNAMTSLAGSLNDSNIFFLDIYTPILGIVQNPQQSGFQVANRACYTPPNPIPCPDRAKYVFWDFVHPTEATDKAVVAWLLKKYANYLK